jgi:uncharacterized protein (DUF885 family)
MKYTLLLKILPFLFILSCAHSSYQSTSTEELFSDHWRWKMKMNPDEALSFSDSSAQIDQITPFTEQHFAKIRNGIAQYLERARKIDSESLSAEDQKNLFHFKFLLDNELKSYDFGSHYFLLTSTFNYHYEFIAESEDINIKNIDDAKAYVRRLQNFKKTAKEIISMLEAGRKKGLVPPARTMKGFEDNFKGIYNTSAKKSQLFKPLETTNRLSTSQKKEIEPILISAINNSFYPAIKEIESYYIKTYKPSLRKEIGIDKLPGGKQYYADQVKKFTTTSMTPDEVHQIGLSEVARIKAEMLQVIKKTGLKKDFKSFVNHLRTHPKFYARTKQELLEKTAFALKKMDGELPRLFRNLPRTPYGIKEIPSHAAPKSTTAYYSRPALDGTRAGFYYVNTYNLKARPLYEIEALSLHEAVPGHHLQIAKQIELKNVPMFLKTSYGFTAFVEGWALYAEKLGLEVGFYQDPYSDFGRLSYEMWRALRLVVDTGIHSKNWSRQKAIEYMLANSALTKKNVESEVDRYINWPGQAVSYKIGQLKISELRKRAEKELGSKFDIREFHDVVLRQGAISLEYLEKNVNSYVNL